MTARTSGVRRSDNSDEAEAFAQRQAAAPALTLTGGQVGALRHDITDALAFAKSERRIASNHARRLRLDGVISSLTAALAALLPAAKKPEA
jgi:hypothetical protein